MTITAMARVIPESTDISASVAICHLLAGAEYGPRKERKPLYYYQHHITDFNNATRHLTLVERALYRELIDRYYETEKPICAQDFDGLARRVLAKTDEEKAALRLVLAEFFTLENGEYRQKRCDAEVVIYKEKIEKASIAGKASVQRPLNNR